MTRYHVGHTHEADKMETLVGWTCISDSILVFCSSVLSVERKGTFVLFVCVNDTALPLFTYTEFTHKNNDQNQVKSLENIYYLTKN